MWQSWQTGRGCLAAQTYPCVVLRADPEDGDGLDTGLHGHMCGYQRGAVWLWAVDLGLALGCLKRSQACQQHRAIQGSPKLSLLSSSPVNAASHLTIMTALQH